MLTLDVLKLKHLATIRSGPAMTERDIVSQNPIYISRIFNKDKKLI